MGSPPSVVVSGAALDDDVYDDYAYLHLIVGEQLDHLFTKAGTRPAAELAWSTFEHARKPVIGEHSKQPVHIPGVISFPKLGLGYIDFVDVIHGKRPPSESCQYS